MASVAYKSSSKEEDGTIDALKDTVVGWTTEGMRYCDHEGQIIGIYWHWSVLILMGLCFVTGQ